MCSVIGHTVGQGVAGAATVDTFRRHWLYLLMCSLMVIYAEIGRPEVARFSVVVSVKPSSIVTITTADRTQRPQRLGLNTCAGNCAA